MKRPPFKRPTRPVMSRIHCRKCLAYYPQGYDHQCVPWIAALVELRAQKDGPLDRPHWECRACFPDENCPPDCIQRNHKPAE